MPQINCRRHTCTPPAQLPSLPPPAWPQSPLPVHVAFVMRRIRHQALGTAHRNCAHSCPAFIFNGICQQACAEQQIGGEGWGGDMEVAFVRLRAATSCTSICFVRTLRPRPLPRRSCTGQHTTSSRELQKFVRSDASDSLLLHISGPLCVIKDSTDIRLPVRTTECSGWARTAAADRWMGFDDRNMSAAAAAFGTARGLCSGAAMPTGRCSAAGAAVGCEDPAPPVAAAVDTATAASRLPSFSL